MSEEGDNMTPEPATMAGVTTRAVIDIGLEPTAVRSFVRVNGEALEGVTQVALQQIVGEPPKLRITFIDDDARTYELDTVSVAAISRPQQA